MNVMAFSEIQMIPIIEELKKKEFDTGIIKRQVIVENNLLYLVAPRQQYVEAYCYFKISSSELSISSQLLRKQTIIRIIKNKLHIGIKPVNEFDLTLEKNESNTNCIIHIKYHCRNSCPNIRFFAIQIEKLQEIIYESLRNPILDLQKEDVKAFIRDGDETGLYDDDEDDVPNYNEYDNDHDDLKAEWKTEYQQRSIEEQGYDDYDLMYGQQEEEEEEEEENDEGYYTEQSTQKLDEIMGV